MSLCFLSIEINFSSSRECESVEDRALSRGDSLPRSHFRHSFGCGSTVEKDREIPSRNGNPQQYGESTGNCPVNPQVLHIGRESASRIRSTDFRMDGSLSRADSTLRMEWMTVE